MSKYSVKFTKKFKRSYTKLSRSGADIGLLDEVIMKLQNGEKLEKKYRDHELIGNFSGFRECHIEFDWVLVYYYEDNILVLTLFDTGSHASVLGL